MSESKKYFASRREFLKNTGRIAAATALAGMAIPHVHAAEDNTHPRGADRLRRTRHRRGGRRHVGQAGTGQARRHGRRVRGSHLKSSYDNLQESFADKVDVPDDRKFVGFDAYKKAMDCLRPGDIAIFATPLAFRGVNCAYAVEKGLNVFMEKPVTADGPTSRRLLELGKQASAKNLKVAVGLMSRHARHLQEVQKRIQDGEIGDLVTMRGYRMHGPVASFCFAEMARNPQRTALADSAFPQFPLGQRRRVQRLLHPHHRSSAAG